MHRKHHTDNPYSLHKISTTALFVLLCKHAEEPKKEVPGLSIKKEHVNFSKIDQNFLNGISACWSQK